VRAAWSLAHEPFKNLINAAAGAAAAAHLARHGRGFDAARFTALALPGLDALELKARAMQICARWKPRCRRFDERRT
jgi:hypothetical protein